ncbi:TIGR02569 family protein [Rhodococcus spongiicola]|uniref:TIGR02569 family protein n=1 Tax=Rhodococcus spongiicola TaxID=2487352 RepID=A0A438B1Z7_9NOCA|nr:TIGR02569 family protein [Rhodococcus spongiicola]RVW04988.1 TIGR02569 family protein [Rhodococcus spongiicola]
MSSGQPPQHICSIFGLGEVELVVASGAGWDGGWRLGDVVLSPVADHARAAWSARVRETLAVDAVRLARPVRASDGRYVVSGWCANTYIEGAPEPRYDEVVSLSLRLHAATAQLARPRFLMQPAVAPWADVDVFVAADRAAWETVPLRSARAVGALEGLSGDGKRSIELIGQLASLRKPVRAPDQLVHGDLFGTVLFSGSTTPAVTDLTPYWRPAVWAAGVTVVDALSWGGADEGLIGRWEDLPEWPQMLLRALLFRLAVHALHPRSTPEALPGLVRTAELVRLIL